MTARRPAPALRQQKPAGAATGRNLHERIANEIGERIISGVYPPESPLPTEADLSASLGISRSVLREAFKLLSAKGLIVSRQKIGAMVRPQAEWNTVPTDHFVSSLFEVRKIVEPAAAALAAERRTAELVRRIETALADMVRFQNAPGDLIAADLRFHQAVLDTTGNPFLASFGAVIESSLIGSFQLSWNAEANTPDYALRQHRTVFEAIRDGQPNDAFAAMTQLLRSAIEDVRDALLHRQIRMNAQG